VQNNLLELWGLLHWLYPSIFTDASERLFKNSFDLSRGSYSIPFLNTATQFLSTIMLRRTKAVVVGDELPPREELTVFIPLTDAQRFWTYRLLTKMDTPYLLNIFSDNKPGIKLEGEEASQERPEVNSRSEDPPAVNNAAEGSRNAFSPHSRAR
jgi:SWI/SNF-related matrix-associated actin-dependent regulator of chromatin subfamily A member 5